MLKERRNQIVEQTIRQAARKKIRRRVLALLSAIVLVLTTNQLIFFADTLERIEACGLAEHSHTDECYGPDGSLTCILPEHVHTDACYQERPKKAAEEAEEDVVAETDVELEDVPQELEAFEFTDDAQASEPGTAPEEAVETAEAQSYRYVVGAQSMVYLRDILAAVGLDADDDAEVGQVVDPSHPEGMIRIENTDAGTAIVPTRDFSEVELAVFAGDGLYTVSLLDATAPQAEPEPEPAPVEAAETIEVAAVEEPAESPEETVEAEPVETVIETQDEVLTDSEPEAEPAEEEQTLVGNDSGATKTVEEQTEVSIVETVEREAAEVESEPTSEVADTSEGTSEADVEPSPEVVTVVEETPDETPAEDGEATDETADEAVEDEGVVTEETVDAADESEVTGEDEATNEDEVTEETADTEGEAETEEAADDEGEATEETVEGEGETVEDPDTDVINRKAFQATYDLTEAAAPFSLKAWIADARAAETVVEDANDGEATEAEPSENEAAEAEPLPVDEWQLTYDAEDIAVEAVEDDWTVTPVRAFEATELSVDTGDAVFALTLLNQAAEDEIELIDDSAEPYAAEIDLTDAVAPFSLTGWMAQARPEDAETAPAEEWTLEYDSEIFAVELTDGDYSVTPLSDFTQATFAVNAGEARYELTLLNWTEEVTELLTGEVSVDVEGANYKLLIDVPEEAQLPADATFKATVVDDASYGDAALGAMTGEGEFEVLATFDLTIYQGDQVIQPKNGVALGVGVDFGSMLPADTSVYAVHFPGTGAQPEVEPVLQAQAEQQPMRAKRSTMMLEAQGLEVEVEAVNGPSLNTELIDAENNGNGVVSFHAESFSVYTIVGRIEATVITADGATYKITVTYDPDAGVPYGAQLEAFEVVEGDAGYDSHISEAAEAIGSTVEGLTHARLFDIRIVDAVGEKVTLTGPVQVKIEYVDPVEIDVTQPIQVVHFGDAGTEVIQPLTNRDEDGNVNVFDFEATSFSYYAVTSYGATADLAGKSFAIVQVNTQATEEQSIGNNKAYQGRALTANATNNNTRLSGATVSVETHESGLNLVSSGTTQIVKWEFVSAGGANTYNIKAPNGQYLTLNGTNALALSDTQQALTVTAGTGNNAGKVRISNGQRRVQSSVSAAAARTANNNQYFYNGNSNDANDVYLTLCGIEEFDPNAYPVYSGEKISVQDLVDAGKYIIYKNIYNSITNKYEDWVIDGNGNPVRAYDQGDSLSLHSEISPIWVLSVLVDSNGQPTGYYIFRNEETGLILHPLADGTLVKEYDPGTSPTTDGVSLKGRQGADYNSTIEYWDGSAMAYYGYQITSEGQVAISSGTGNNSQAFSFAEQKTAQSGLHVVDTVDSVADGITIHMFNYPNRDTIANVTGSDGYGVGALPAPHASNVLNNDGYPTFKNGTSNGSTLFNPSNTYHQGTGNRLFLDSIYESTGYYEYSAFNNFAHYNSDGTFTVYEETGTPSPTSSNFYFKRGNFFPYNNLNTNSTAQNIYTGSGNLIDYENPSYGDTLYGFREGVDFYFGMTMDFNFLMPKDGYDKGNPLIYEFNGDDDLWIYIDGVLILDIGGVHDAFPGSINFATGEITGGNGGAGKARTIKQCFKNAGVFPDGTQWDDRRVDEYFKGDTFVSYGRHQFNMFYMEHGAGASNLQIRFNLPVIERGKVTVEKVLDNTSQVDYANVSFAFQVYAKNEHGEYVTRSEAVYEGKTDANGNPVPIDFYDDVVIDGVTYNDVFYLKPEEAAVFSDMLEDDLYYVQEIGVKSDYYDEVFVNDVKIDGKEVVPDTDSFIYRSSEATARNRARVTYSNHCDVMNSNELLITKRLEDGSIYNGDTFEFRVMLENAAGELVAYHQGTYYIRDDKGVYYRFQNGALVSNGETPYPMTAGNFGTISQIPPDYTVVISELLVGTDFYVDEIRVRQNGSTSDVLVGDSVWTLTETKVEEYGAPEITSATIYDYATGRNVTRSALGTIALDKDAHVTFTNKRTTMDVSARKKWVRADGTTNLIPQPDPSEPPTEPSPQPTNLPSVTFQLYQQVGEKGDILPMEGRTVVLDGKPDTDLTVDNYESPAWTANFANLPKYAVVEGQRVEITYLIDETAAPNGFVKLTNDKVQNGGEIKNAQIEVELELLKVDSTNANVALPGAKFMLYTSYDPDDPTQSVPAVDADGNPIVEFETDENGEFEIGSMLLGTYILVETKAPDGYNIMTGPITLRVEKNQQGQITVSYVQNNESLTPTVSKTGNAKYTCTFRITNNPGARLPDTGGVGTVPFTVGGLSLMGIALFLLMKRRLKAE